MIKILRTAPNTPSNGTGRLLDHDHFDAAPFLIEV
jgi:hypothetical protein